MTLSKRQIEKLSQIRVELTQDCQAPYSLNKHLEPYLLTLNDVCDALELDAAQKQQVLGEPGMEFIARWQAQPVNIAIVQALARLDAESRNGGPS